MAPSALVGKPAPSFTLPDAEGAEFTFTPGDKGVPTALFFYPKSGTYGCTREACQFRDALANDDLFKRATIEVIGVSSDPVDKQKDFVTKQKLTYPVLSDSKGEAKKAYQLGKGLLGLTEARTTFFIDSKGVVRDTEDTVLNFGAHVKFIEKWLKKIEAEEKSGNPDATAEATTTAADAIPAADAAPETTPTSAGTDAAGPTPQIPLSDTFPSSTPEAPVPQ